MPDVEKAALVIGIDHYDNIPQPLTGAVADATRVAKLLRENGDHDETRNFEVTCLTSDKGRVDEATVRAELTRLFASNSDDVLVYFAGHGIVDTPTGNGYALCADAAPGRYGIQFNDMLANARRANGRIRSKTFVLDCCHAGAIAAGLTPDPDPIGEAGLASNVTILAAASRDQKAVETNRGGVFTKLFIDGLHGAASSVLGHVTAASLYAYVEQALGPLEQRPLFKANVDQFRTVRRVAPRIPMRVLRRLARKDYFETPDSVFVAGPDCQQPVERGQYRDTYGDIPYNPDRGAIFRDLQSCYSCGLVEPVAAEFMWMAAMHKPSGEIQLTELGRYIHRLVTEGRI